nr:MAG TPA: hypothetical protein [Bacteriophage sp.]
MVFRFFYPYYKSKSFYFQLSALNLYNYITLHISLKIKSFLTICNYYTRYYPTTPQPLLYIVLKN